MRRAGREVLDVVVIGMGAATVAYRDLDAIARRLRLPAVLRDALLHSAMRAGFGLERLVRAPASERWDDLRKVLGKAMRERTITTGVHEDLERSDAFVRYCHVHRFYIPRSYDGRVTILWPKEQVEKCGDIQRDWSRVAPNIDIAYVSGSHHAAVSRHIGEIASEMRLRFSA